MKRIFKLFIATLATAVALQADVKTDLNNLNTGIVDLNGSVATTVIDVNTMCATLASLNKQSRDMINAIKLVDESLAAPLSIDADMLVIMENLFVNVASLSNEAVQLGTNVTLLKPTMDAISLDEALSSMLQLSSDIGEMADRIGAMADKILVMADNIGLMADRIIQTQTIQSQNLAQTQGFVLESQNNMLALVSVLETASYNLTIDALIAQGQWLAAKMMAVVFSPWTIDDQMRELKNDTAAFLANVKAFETTLDGDTLNNMMYINTLSLTSLSNLSIMMTSLATAIDGLVIGVESVKNITRDATLLDAMGSMLTLSADIGKMANSILDMGDVILAMADNIGMVADEIVATQTLQSANIATTQTAILAAQVTAVGIIATIN